MPKQPKEVPDPQTADEPGTVPTDNAPDALDPPPEVPHSALDDPTHLLHHLRNT